MEIFNEREDRLLALVVAIPNYKLVPSDKTDLRFWETPEGNPVALKAWFFPGDTWGQELSTQRPRREDRSSNGRAGASRTAGGDRG